MTESLAKLFHDRRILLINHDRTTITVVDVDRESVKWELDLAGFVATDTWSHGQAVDIVPVRRKTHRFDAESNRRKYA